MTKLHAFSAAVLQAETRGMSRSFCYLVVTGPEFDLEKPENFYHKPTRDMPGRMYPSVFKWFEVA